MKTLFLTTILLLGVTMTSYGQEKLGTAISRSKSELAQSKTNGKYAFTLPSGTSSEKVQQNAKYYTNYFTVEYAAATNIASITMVTNDERSRHVICRFLIASGVDKINVDGTELPVEEFYTNYLK